MADHEQQTDDVGLSDDLEIDSEHADGVRGGVAATEIISKSDTTVLDIGTSASKTTASEADKSDIAAMLKKV
ncbi:MAG: hypothetical protein ABSB73_14355 [Solirubrobacteraceae bacterium]|jgi:hypothetical protein